MTTAIKVKRCGAIGRVQFRNGGSYQGIASAMPSEGRDAKGFSRWPDCTPAAAEAGIALERLRQA